MCPFFVQPGKVPKKEKEIVLERELASKALDLRGNELLKQGCTGINIAELLAGHPDKVTIPVAHVIWLYYMGVGPTLVYDFVMTGAQRALTDELLGKDLQTVVGRLDQDNQNAFVRFFQNGLQKAIDQHFELMLATEERRVEYWNLMWSVDPHYISLLI